MNEYTRLKSKYPDKVPLIVECDKLKKKKYLVPTDLTVSQLVCYFRKKMVLKPTEAVYIFIKYDGCSVIPKHSDLLSMYEKCNVVYMSIKFENTFGDFGEAVIDDWTVVFITTILIWTSMVWWLVL